MLPQTWSRQTGMMGAGLRLTICSKPRWNGSRKPVRVMPPSAKMHTTSPAANASLAVRSDWIMARGPAVDRNHARDAQDESHSRNAREWRPDDKTHASRLRRQDQDGVDPADVV